MVREEEVLSLDKLLLTSVVSGEEKPTRTGQGIVIEMSPDHFINCTGYLIFADNCQLTIFELHHAKLATLLAADHVKAVHEAN